MRFPLFADLDREQRRVYGRAPNDGAILVVGPPGTGKTIMAFHRAQKVKALGQKPYVIMFNRVLLSYTKQRKGVAEDIPSATMHYWVKHWWRMGGMGQNPPKIYGSRFDIDWNEIEKSIVSLDTIDTRLARLNWGHLIIDEGQDFPEHMYFTLGRLVRYFKRYGQDARITVFADDNQRLEDSKNSTIDSIAKNLGLKRSGDRVFYLSKNYRNTIEISRFARYFQVGKSSGVASSPSRSGDMPSTVFFHDDIALASFILNTTRLNPGKQVGVIVTGTGRRLVDVYNLLAQRNNNNEFRLQRYLSKEGQTNLDFGYADTITLVHQKSAKGLEFDLVFYIGIEQLNANSSGGTDERMALYVMSSRPREELYLCFVDTPFDNPAPDGLTLFPSPIRNLCRYESFNGQSASLEKYLDRVNWREPDIDSPYWEGE